MSIAKTHISRPSSLNLREVKQCKTVGKIAINFQFSLKARAMAIAILHAKIVLKLASRF